MKNILKIGLLVLSTGVFATACNSANNNNGQDEDSIGTINAPGGNAYDTEPMTTPDQTPMDTTGTGMDTTTAPAGSDATQTTGGDTSSIRQ